MKTKPPAIEIINLSRKFGPTDAVNGLNLTVKPGRCYGFFGRNGAGKTTTIKCLLNLLKPTAGDISVFGFNPQEDEVQARERISYVPDQVAFYPWMTVRDTLDYLAAFRKNWDRKTERELLDRFALPLQTKAVSLSKGQKTQLALIGAICANTELLILDEPTSGLDPIVRREFIQTIIGAYQNSGEGNRTVFVSTHLISEFEGLIDEFTIIENGRALLTMETEEARSRFKRIYARFHREIPEIPFEPSHHLKRNGRVIEFTCNTNIEALLKQITALHPESVEVQGLSLEEMFIASVGNKAA